MYNDAEDLELIEGITPLLRDLTYEAIKSLE
jgi:hypothetical protein